MGYINTKRPEIKTVIVEDAQYLMAFEAMDRANEKGYGKFTDIAQKFYSILKLGVQMRDDLNIIVIGHSENIGDADNPQWKMKTIGRMLDNTITVEGLFTYVLFTVVKRNDDNSVEYLFQTHSDGTNTAKTPMDCFDEDYIPNDLQYVIDKIKEYDA